MRAAGASVWETVDLVLGLQEEAPTAGTTVPSSTVRPLPAKDAPGMWHGRRIFPFRVGDASMADEGVREGDHLLLEARETFDPGQTVLAEVQGKMTVKRLFFEAGGRLRLEPANRELLPLVTAAERVRIVGAVVGIVRRQGFRTRARRAARTRERADAWTLDLALRAIGEPSQGRGDRGRVRGAGRQAAP